MEGGLSQYHPQQQESPLKRKQLLKIVNCGLGILFFAVGLTGLFPDQTPKRVFDIAHEEGGKVFVFFALAHLALNWAWVKNTLLRQKKPLA